MAMEAAGATAEAIAAGAMAMAGETAGEMMMTRTSGIKCRLPKAAQPKQSR